MLDIHQIMAGLSKRRPIFHSEADFQHALAWRIRETRPDAEVRLEFNPLPDTDSRIAVDIWLRLPEATVAIELKYCIRELREEWRGERFALRNHGAQPPRRYDFVRDLQRLEAVRQIPNLADYGFAVLLTNDSGYWTPPTQADTTDSAFRIHDGRQLNSGELRWSDSVGAGTKSGREEAILLDGSYSLQWRTYSYPGNQSAQRFRYLAVSVPATSGAPVAGSMASNTPTDIPVGSQVAQEPDGFKAVGNRRTNLVEDAVRQALGSGCVLLTPGVGFPPQRQAEFIGACDARGINISKISKQYVTWEILEGVVPYLQERNGIIEIGAKNNADSKPDTLDYYLKSSYKVSLMTASYVASILEKAGVVCYDRFSDREAKCIRLLPPFTEDNRQ